MKNGRSRSRRKAKFQIPSSKLQKRKHLNTEAQRAQRATENKIENEKAVLCGPLRPLCLCVENFIFRRETCHKQLDRLPTTNCAAWMPIGARRIIYRWARFTCSII